MVVWSSMQLGINMGYYRLWYQESYVANYSLRVFLAVSGASCLKGSIKEWMHIHGKSTDDKDPVMKWQHENYGLICCVLMGLPIIIGFVINNIFECTFYGILVPQFFSYLWTLGFKSFSECKLLKNGNYYDGGKNYDLDKFCIWIATCFGLATVQYGNEKKAFKDGVESFQIKEILFKPNPTYTMDEFNQLIEDHPKKSFTIISGEILDITGFEKEHPGGSRYINFIKGIDGTPEFYGSLHRHSKEAKEWANQKKFAKLIQEVSKAG